MVNYGVAMSLVESVLSQMSILEVRASLLFFFLFLFLSLSPL